MVPHSKLASSNRRTISMKRKCRHFDEIFVTGCTGSCHFDNFQWGQWWTFHQNKDIVVPVYEHTKYNTLSTKNAIVINFPQNSFSISAPWPLYGHSLGAMEHDPKFSVKVFFLCWLFIYGMPIVISRGVWRSHSWAIWEIQDGRQYGRRQLGDL